MYEFMYTYNPNTCWAYIRIHLSLNELYFVYEHKTATDVQKRMNNAMCMKLHTYTQVYRYILMYINTCVVLRNVSRSFCGRSKQLQILLEFIVK